MITMYQFKFRDIKPGHAVVVERVAYKVLSNAEHGDFYTLGLKDSPDLTGHGDDTLTCMTFHPETSAGVEQSMPQSSYTGTGGVSLDALADERAAVEHSNANQKPQATRVFFIDTCKGDDLTGVINNRAHPFRTWEYVSGLTRHRDHVEFVAAEKTERGQGVTQDASLDALLTSERDASNALLEQERTYRREADRRCEDARHALHAVYETLGISVGSTTSEAIAHAKQTREAINERLCVSKDSTTNAQLNAIIALHEKYEDLARLVRMTADRLGVLHEIRPSPMRALELIKGAFERQERDRRAWAAASDKLGGLLNKTTAERDEARKERDVARKVPASLASYNQVLSDVRVALRVPEHRSLTEAARWLRVEFDEILKIVDAPEDAHPVGAVRIAFEKLTRERDEAQATKNTLHLSVRNLTSALDNIQRERNEAKAIQVTLRGLLEMANECLSLPANAPWETTASVLRTLQGASRRTHGSVSAALTRCANIAQEKAHGYELAAMRHDDEDYDATMNAAWARALAKVARDIEAKILALREEKP